MRCSPNPKALEESAVSHGKARFTVLTSRMIRMEWAEDGRFEDNATLAVINRRTAPVKFKVERKGDALAISTDALTLRCSACSKPFSKETLTASFKVDGKPARWAFGMKDPKNLKGSYRTLDGTAADQHVNLDWGTGKWTPKSKIELCDGLVSRSGWAVHDDSTNILLKPGIAKGRLWVAKRPEGPRSDLYLFAYGLEFQDALKDAAVIFGGQPLPPRYTLGYWYSRYWAYTDKEIEELADQFDSLDVPIDVMVIDMDWHKPGWTGYTWCPAFFPNAKEFLKDLKERDLKITLNLHPADGVASHEEQFEDVCKDLGLHPAKTAKVPFDCTDPKFVDSYFKRLHNPMEDDGVDFWWMDWQQGTGTKMEGLDPLPWLNLIHWEDQAKRSQAKRPLCFSRFGGLGAGRYPVGFSGDTISVWESLAYQPYFTATAANVLYGYWSHDIGGHMPGPIEPELYARWVQFGMLSPILRTHTTKNAEAERRVWEYPSPYSKVMADAIRRRYELAPYIYSENRKALDSGVSLVRPMYYSHPREEAAYKAKGQYMFGESILAAPVVTPAGKDEMSQVEVWLPEGEWIDTATGETLKGPATLKRKYVIEEVPAFVRKGTVLPLQGKVSRLRPGSYKSLVLEVFPGASSETSLYEDDGVSQDYLDGKSALIPLSLKQSGESFSVSVGKAQGSFKGFLKTRPLEVRAFLAAPPKSVKAAGKALAWSRKLSGEGWTYDADKAMLKISLASVDLSKGVKIEVQADPKAPARLADGLKGLMTRLDKIARYVNMVSPARPIHEDERLAALLAQTGNRITRKPGSFKAELAALKKELPRLPKALKSYQAEYRKRKNLKHVETLAKAIAILATTMKEFKG